MTSHPTFQAGGIHYDEIAPRYSAARSMSVETAERWAKVIGPFMPKSQPATVLDLGCGTGRFTALIAERFPVQVIGVDLSLGMLQRAASDVKQGDVFFFAASAECLPLPDNSCDLAWISQVIHHVVDRQACARELHRVVKPDGAVIVRGTFGDRLDSCPTYFRFFPTARVVASQVPTIPDVLQTFRAAGFRLAAFQSVPQKTCNSLRELADRTRLRADTTLVLLSDAEFERCQSDLERAAANERTPQPVIETVDVLILRPHA